MEASAAFSKSLISSMQDGLSVLDDEGRIVAANPALCRMTRFFREELVGLTSPCPCQPWRR